MLLPDGGRTKDVTFGGTPNAVGPSNGTPDGGSPTSELTLIPAGPATIYVTGWDANLMNGQGNPIWTKAVQCPGGEDVEATIDMAQLP